MITSTWLPTPPSLTHFLPPPFHSFPFLLINPTLSPSPFLQSSLNHSLSLSPAPPSPLLSLLLLCWPSLTLSLSFLSSPIFSISHTFLPPPLSHCYIYPLHCPFLSLLSTYPISLLNSLNTLLSSPSSLAPSLHITSFYQAVHASSISIGHTVVQCSLHELVYYISACVILQQQLHHLLSLGTDTVHERSLIPTVLNHGKEQNLPYCRMMLVMAHVTGSTVNSRAVCQELSNTN